MDKTILELESALEILDGKRLAGEAWSREEAKRIMAERNEKIKEESAAARKEAFAIMEEARKIRTQRAAVGAAGVGVKAKEGKR